MMTKKTMMVLVPVVKVMVIMVMAVTAAVEMTTTTTMMTMMMRRRRRRRKMSRSEGGVGGAELEYWHIPSPTPPISTGSGVFVRGRLRLGKCCAQNPIPYLNAVHKRHPNIDFIISSDAPTSHAKMPFKKDNNYLKVDGAMELGLEDCLVNHAPFNIGIMWFAAHQKSVEVLHRFAATVENIHEVDQWPINLMLREGMMERIFKIRDKFGENGDRAAYPVDNGRFNMGVFNTPQFSSALVYSVTQAWRIEGLKPYAIHLTYVQNQHLQSKVCLPTRIIHGKEATTHPICNKKQTTFSSTLAPPPPPPPQPAAAAALCLCLPVSPCSVSFTFICQSVCRCPPSPLSSPPPPPSSLFFPPSPSLP